MQRSGRGRGSPCGERLRARPCGGRAGGSAGWLCAVGAHTGLVSPVPAGGTPALATTETTEQVRQLVQCGGTMYAVGTFTEIRQSGTEYSRNNAFSFGATAPYKITKWEPDVNGTVNSIALSSNCAQAYIGGAFTKVDGQAATNIADIRTNKQHDGDGLAARRQLRGRRHRAGAAYGCKSAGRGSYPAPAWAA